MRKRCPQSKKVGIARLLGYRWITSARGYANVVESQNTKVEGLCYMICDSDEDSLWFRSSYKFQRFSGRTGLPPLKGHAMR